MTDQSGDDRRFEAGRGGTIIRGSVESGGERRPIVLVHGLTAHRDLVVHGSRALARGGHPVVRYDARAHGESDPGDPGSYDYEHLVADLEAVCEAELAGGGGPVLVGHSMGAHTIVAAALRDPDRYAALVVIGPVSSGEAPGEQSLQRWDALAAGLEKGGADGFIEAYDNRLDPDWRETLLRIARDRLERHRNPDALAQALREIPRSAPFDGLTSLSELEIPVLVVGSHDLADPGHPLTVARDYAEAIPSAKLVTESDEDESPLAWQGGKLSREIEEFLREVGANG